MLHGEHCRDSMTGRFACGSPEAHTNIANHYRVTSRDESAESAAARDAREFGFDHPAMTSLGAKYAWQYQSWLTSQELALREAVTR